MLLIPEAPYSILQTERIFHDFGTSSLQSISYPRPTGDLFHHDCLTSGSENGIW